jgi:hypothetical protein
MADVRTIDWHVVNSLRGGSPCSLYRGPAWRNEGRKVMYSFSRSRQARLRQQMGPKEQLIALLVGMFDEGTPAAGELQQRLAPCSEIASEQVGDPDEQQRKRACIPAPPTLADHERVIDPARSAR